MKPDVSDISSIMRGYREGGEIFDRIRINRIRNSDILVDGPLLQDAFESAKFLRFTKPLSGLVELRRILSKMHK